MTLGGQMNGRTHGGAGVEEKPGLTWFPAFTESYGYHKEFRDDVGGGQMDITPLARVVRDAARQIG